MSLILDGTNGLSDVDGTAAAPAIRGTDTNTGIFFGADIIGFSEGGAEVARFNADAQFVAAAGTAALPVITTTGDVNTGIFFPAADTIAFAEGGVEAMRITSTGDVGIGTSSPASILELKASTPVQTFNQTTANSNQGVEYRVNGTAYGRILNNATTGILDIRNGLTPAAGYVITFSTDGTERARIDSGNFLIGKTAGNIATGGVQFETNGTGGFTRDSNTPLQVNRLTDDGTLVSLQQATVQEGSISVSGTTVSYNGGHLSRWAQTAAPKDESIVKGTVMSNLDAMNVYTDADGNPVDNEQLNKVKVSDVEGDANVAGVFVNWTHDDQHNVDEINMAMTGDMIIRIAQGTTVARGDLLMSAGDGTAKPQGDDIVRSKTVAKVTSTHVTCTYADGSFCVPCVLMAC